MTSQSPTSPYSEAELDAKQGEAGLLIHAFAVAHGAVAFFLANTALVDGPILAGMTLWMIHKLGRIYGREDVNVAQIFWNIFQYVAGTWLATKVLFFVPGLGNWANAVTTMLVTETIGWACIYLFSENIDLESMTREQWKKIARLAKKEGKKHNAENKKVLSKASNEEKERLRRLSNQLKDDSIPEDQKESLLRELTELYAAIRDR